LPGLICSIIKLELSVKILEKKLIRKQVITITKVEEINFSDLNESNKINNLVSKIWKFLKKYFLSDELLKGEKNG